MVEHDELRTRAVGQHRDGLNDEDQHPDAGQVLEVIRDEGVTERVDVEEAQGRCDRQGVERRGEHDPAPPPTP